MKCYCMYCGTKIEDKDRYCNECGHNTWPSKKTVLYNKYKDQGLKTTKVCSKCGYDKIFIDDVYCQECGYNFSDDKLKTNDELDLNKSVVVTKYIKQDISYTKFASILSLGIITGGLSVLFLKNIFKK